MKRFLLPILTGVAAVAAHAQESDSVRMYRLQQIEVTATRATLRTPVAYTDLSHDAIARNSYGTDIPTVLALTPSMIAPTKRASASAARRSACAARTPRASTSRSTAWR